MVPEGFQLVEHSDAKLWGLGSMPGWGLNAFPEYHDPSKAHTNFNT